MSIRVRSICALTLALALSAPALAKEKVIWQLGTPDHSDHEFTAWPNPQAKEPLVVRIGSGQEEKQWPRFHPGSANAAMGARPYAYTLVFNLTEPPRGVFYLDLALLFRHPRVPVLEVHINGHRGDFYLEPKFSFALGDEDDAFNPIHSSEQRRIALPAEYLQKGENRLTLVCLDEPPTVAQQITAGGPGDSGLYYDALALVQDPEARPEDKLAVSFAPTVFFRQASAGLVEECLLTVRYPGGWPGGKAKVSIGGFSTETTISKKGEFGETRMKVEVPDGTPAGEAQIALASTRSSRKKGAREQTYSVGFSPQRKWQVFYAPHEHLDIGYTDYQAKVAEGHSQNIDDLLNILPTHPDYRFNVDGSWIIEQWLQTRTAAQARRFKEEARAGRIAVDGLYANLMTGLLSTEEYFRSQYLSKALEGRYGVPFDAAWITDVPSHSWSLPSALAAAGVRYFASGGNQTRGPLLAYGHWNARSPFWWEGPDGGRVLAWYSYHYHQLRATFGIPPTLEAGEGALPRFLQPYERADYRPDAVLLYGTEVENVPLEFKDADLAGQWNSKYAYPKIIPCRFADYFRYVEQHFSKSLPVVRGDGGAYWEDGAGTDAQATSRYRSAQTRALAADTLAALMTGLRKTLAFPHALDREIWRNLLLYNEHTFTSYLGPGQPHHDEVVGQLGVKNGRTVRAEMDIDHLMRLGMSQLADAIETQGENLVVFNPLSWPRSGLVRFQVSSGTVLTEVSTNTPVSYEVAEKHGDFQTIRFWARAVPALGYKVYHLGLGAKTEPVRAESESNVIQNQYYRITFDPTRAAIKSLYDKELGRELLDPSSPYLLNEYLYVTGGGSEKGRGEGSEATQLTHLAQSLPFAELSVHHPEHGEIVSVTKTPWGHVVCLTAEALNTPRIETEIFLPDNEKRIEFRNHIHKKMVYAKEAAYFAFPWAAADPTFRFDIANGIVNPEKDLLSGADVEWFSPESWVNVEDGTAAMTLAALDAPLVSLCDINRGRWPRRFEKSSSWVFSYALNNYWFTNTAPGQSGEFTFRYAITSAAHFRPEGAARFGREARSPLEISELRESDKGPWAKGGACRQARRVSLGSSPTIC